MTTKTIPAVLGPAILFALLVQFFNLASILPPFVLSFLLALLASIATLFLISSSGKTASTSNKSTTTVAASSRNTGKSSGGKELGNVKWFNSNKGFGFITRENGEEIFVHFRSIVNGKSLRDGQRVEFAVTTGTKGLQAEEVVALK
jgi:CspA family cold shock protein